MPQPEVEISQIRVSHGHHHGHHYDDSGNHQLAYYPISMEVQILCHEITPESFPTFMAELEDRIRGMLGYADNT